MEEAGREAARSLTSGAPGRERVLERADDGQLLVLDVDPLEPAAAAVARLGRDRRDRLAVEAHLVDRDDRAVLDRVPVVGVDVARGRRAVRTQTTPGIASCRAEVSIETMRACGERAAQHLSVQHARDDDVAGELRLAAELLARVAARGRAPDLLGATRRHSTTVMPRPASSATASRIPR